MNPGMAEIRFGNNATHKKLAAPWGTAAFYLLPADPEQSGDATALTTTSAIKRQSAGFSRSRFGLETP
jgi:hypothetical protein